MTATAVHESDIATRISALQANEDPGISEPTLVDKALDEQPVTWLSTYGIADQA